VFYDRIDEDIDEDRKSNNEDDEDEIMINA
jgi:hypothetical protein